jgi:hypothetical protein
MARAKTFLNFEGGWPTSEESSPTAMIPSLKGSASVSVFSADSSERWRKKHIIM